MNSKPLLAQKSSLAGIAVNCSPRHSKWVVGDRSFSDVSIALADDSRLAAFLYITDITVIRVWLTIATILSAKQQWLRAEGQNSRLRH